MRLFRVAALTRSARLSAAVTHRPSPYASPDVPEIADAMLSGMCGSIQQELDRFAANLQGSTDLQREVTAQAFSKARKGFSAAVFRMLNTTLLHLIETRLSLSRWRGFRVAAADASKLQLFLKDANGRKVREAIALMMYLPGTEMALDFELYSPEVSERQILFEHLDISSLTSFISKAMRRLPLPVYGSTGNWREKLWIPARSSSRRPIPSCNPSMSGCRSFSRPISMMPGWIRT